MQNPVTPAMKKRDARQMVQLGLRISGQGTGNLGSLLSHQYF
jgi:hypothetical protein